MNDSFEVNAIRDRDGDLWVSVNGVNWCMISPSDVLDFDEDGTWLRIESLTAQLGPLRDV